ncbi:MAG TPA: hypothetical protein VGW38_08225 [Chloroflexota bacterium]|nr:hypothetical protein [Chloroflexota bacterium]
MTAKTMLAALVCLPALLAACGPPAAGTPQAAGSAEPSAEAFNGGPVPDSVIEILRRGEYDVEAGTFDDGGISAEAAVSEFHRQYAPETFGDEIMVYAAVLRNSGSRAMSPGTAIRVLHIPDVTRPFEGPAPPPGAEPQDHAVTTDLVAFFDAESGEFYETSFIGQQ